MTDSEAGHVDTGETTEMSLSDLRRLLPAEPEQLRDQLPGLEPERRITDWGRSERIEGMVDRTVYDFLYHYWFRVEVEGIENVPEEGGALLVSNHSGAMPSDGAMIVKAVRQEHPHRRPVHLATESAVGGLPGLGMLATKLGAVGGHPANLQRLLFDERQLVLAFPEGRRGVRKPIKERYRLRRFDRLPFVETAISAGVPIVPLAVLGAEEALPVFGSLRALLRVPLSTGLPLPAKFRIRFLEPVETEHLGVKATRERGMVEECREAVRALIQENLLELVAQRRSVWLG